ncbi:MAG: hypothetical protein ACFFCS_02645 [Candidatus Hodarchaeota archaeon]
MNVKKTILNIISEAGDKGIQLDKIVDKINALFPNKYYSDDFIIDYLKKQEKVELFFVPLNNRTHFAYKIKE